MQKANPIQAKRIRCGWILSTAVAAVVLTAVPAGATIPLNEQREIYSSQVKEAQGDKSQAAQAVEKAKKSKTHAPEPSTLALFGSGLLGMIVSFIRRTYWAAKRAFDVVISLLAFVVLSPLFLITSVLIKCTSKGPIFYRQVRVGKGGKPFWIYKFRTMKVDAEKHSGAIWAAENDPRLIPVGKLLRKTHVDEIPQFYNVLIGDMSFIGPRPERPEFVWKFSQEISDYEKRLQVKPGITGLAQVWHNYDATIRDVRKKIKYDLLYIKNLCLWTDVQIFLRTFRVVLTGEGAR